MKTKYKKTLLITLISLFTTAYANNPVILKISRSAHQFMQRNHVPGLAVDVYYNGKPYYFTFGVAKERAGTLVTKNTIFEIDSITKSFTATILAEEVLQKQIQLNQVVGPFLPKRLRNSNSSIKKVTFKQLATHTASLPRDPANFRGENRLHYNAAKFFEYLKNWQPPYPVGTKYQYSDVGYGVLAYALAGVAHERYHVLLRQKLLDPLQMNQTTMFVSKAEQKNYARGESKSGKLVQHWKMEPWKPGGGALRSTPVDMMKFLEANLGIGSAPANIKAAMQFTHQAYFPVSANMKQGLAWARYRWKDGKISIAKDGGDPGFSSYIAFIEGSRNGVVILANKGDVPVGHLSHHILLLLMASSKNVVRELSK